MKFAHTMQNEIEWADLKVGQTYYTKTTGFNPFGHIIKKVVIESIRLLSASEAMIYADQGRGFGVGGMFEGELGPRSRFWLIDPNLVDAAAVAA